MQKALVPTRLIKRYREPRRFLAIGSILNLLSNLLFQFLLISTLQDKDSDAYLASAAISVTFLSPLQSLLPNLLVSKYNSDSSLAKITHLALSTAALLIVLPAAVLVIFTYNFFSPVLFAGFSIAQRDLAYNVLPLQFASSFFQLGIAIAYCNLFRLGKSFQSDIAIASITALCCLLWKLSPLLDSPLYAAILSVLRSAILCISLFAMCGPLFLERSQIALCLREILKVLKAAFVSLYTKTELIVDRALLASMAPGTISSWTLAQMYSNLVANITTKIYLLPAFEVLSEEYNSIENSKSFKMSNLVQSRNNQIMQTSVKVSRLILVSFLFLIATRALLAFNKDLVENLSSPNTFNLLINAIDFSLLSTAIVLAGLLIQLTVYSYNSRSSFHAPTLLASFAYTLSVPLKVLMSMRYGFYGFIVATTIYYITEFLALFLFDQNSLRLRLLSLQGDSS